MEEKIVIHGNPNGSVFGLIGNDTSTDDGKFYVKVSEDSKNKGWKEIPPTPTPTQTVSITPSKTPIVTRTPTPNATILPTATPTISLTPSVSPSSAPGTTRTPTPTPTLTSFRTLINYTIVANGPGRAFRVNGPSPTGTIERMTGDFPLQAIPDSGFYLQNWEASDGVVISNPFSLNPEAHGFDTFQDVIITANFGPEALKIYRINAIADARGRVVFSYINDYGEDVEFFEEGFPPRATLYGLACGHIVTSGNAYITSTFC